MIDIDKLRMLAAKVRREYDEERASRARLRAAFDRCARLLHSGAARLLGPRAAEEVFSDIVCVDRQCTIYACRKPATVQLILCQDHSRNVFGGAK